MRQMAGPASIAARFVLTIATATACAAPALAAPVSMTGQTALVTTAPASVLNNAFTSDAAAQLFAERSLTLAANLSVDATAAGTYTSAVPTSVGTIAAGTQVQSYFLSADGVGTSTVVLAGSITFDTDVLGLLYLNGNANSRFHLSDAVLGLSDTAYDSSSAFNGLFDGADVLTLSSDRRTLTFSLATSQYQDQLRIVTAAPSVLAVPEPGSWLLAGTAALAAVGSRRQRRQAAPAASLTRNRQACSSGSV